MKMLKNFFFLLLISLNASLVAQSNFGVGQWRLHSIFGSVKNVVKANNRVYAQSKSALYYYDINEQSLVELSKVDGLSSNQFASIGFDASSNTLVIGYIDGNIDLVSGNEITNINNIQKSNLSGSKNINHIHSKNGRAYLSTDFGLVVLNLNKKEVAETYKSIGLNGANVSVKYSEISSSDSLYILTNEGIKVGNAGGNYNLLDGLNWENIVFSDKVDRFHLFNNKIYAVIGGNKLYKKIATGEERINNPELEIKAITSIGGKMFIVYNESIYTYDGVTSSFLSNDSKVKYWETVSSDASNVLWGGNLEGGIVKYELNTNNLFQYRISGLSSDVLWKGTFTNDKIFVTGGGYNAYISLNNPSIIHSFDNKWTTKLQDLRSSEGVYNAMDMVYNESQQKYYIACYRGGLLEWDGINDFVKIPDSLAPFHSALTKDPWVKVFGLEMYNGEMWATNHETRNLKSIHKMDKDGNWSSYKLNTVHGSFPEDVQVDNEGVLWVKIGSTGAKSGLIYYNSSTGQERYLTTQLNNGGLPHWQVNDYAIDKDNNVWIGTGQGAASFQNTSAVFDNQSYNAVKPIVGGRPLLQDEVITSVAIDGGNRKWFGTNNGVFLFDDTGEKALKTFNVDNSPLPSNIIKDITINGKTGEVFIITASGIASYWSDATESTDKHENVEVFPNPVPPNYDGMVAIRGLATDALVKITDVAGRLVYETNAEGGQVVWNGKDINGNKVKTGVYLIFSSSIEGDERFAGKFAVVE